LQNERQEYKVVESGKRVYKKNGAFVQTSDDYKWIFVLSTTKALYVGQVNINFSLLDCSFFYYTYTLITALQLLDALVLKVLVLVLAMCGRDHFGTPVS